MNARRWRLVAGGMVTLVLLVEAVVRLAGVADFPTYLRSDSFGYVPHGNQSGAFLGRNRWSFNDRSMGSDRPWQPSQRADILLVGNSIVMGGNAYDQVDKMALLLEALLGPGCPVWPVAAGGWSTVNEMRFLQAHPDVVEGTDFFIWELMAGQMGGLQPWVEETQHPTERPWWATGYVVRKALTQRFGWVERAASEAVPRDIERHYAEFERVLGQLASAAGRRPAGVIFLYPDQAQLELARAGGDWMDDRQRIEQLAARYGLMLLDVAQSPRWTSAMYKDGIHPTVEGNRILAGLLADALAKAGVAALCDGGSQAQTGTPRANGQ
jgi:hypothetical protein